MRRSRQHADKAYYDDTATWTFPTQTKTLVRSCETVDKQSTFHVLRSTLEGCMGEVRLAGGLSWFGAVSTLENDDVACRRVIENEFPFCGETFSLRRDLSGYSWKNFKEKPEYSTLIHNYKFSLVITSAKFILTFKIKNTSVLSAAKLEFLPFSLRFVWD